MNKSTQILHMGFDSQNEENGLFYYYFFFYLSHSQILYCSLSSKKLHYYVVTAFSLCRDFFPLGCWNSNLTLVFPLQYLTLIFTWLWVLFPVHSWSLHIVPSSCLVHTVNQQFGYIYILLLLYCWFPTPSDSHWLISNSKLFCSPSVPF